MATSALLASGVFAVAPYIGFLAPVAALSIGLPLIVVSAVFSFVAIALSCAAISKNNTIAEKNKVIDQKTQEGNKAISKQKEQLNQKNTEISRLQEQLSNKEAEVKDHKQKTPEKNHQTTQTEEVGIQEALISGRVNRIVKDGLKDAYSAMPSANSIKEIFGSAYDTSVEYTKSGLTSIGTFLNSVCDVIAHPTAKFRYF